MNGLGIGLPDKFRAWHSEASEPVALRVTGSL
jgi:hypothetical protein